METNLQYIDKRLEYYVISKFIVVLLHMSTHVLTCMCTVYVNIHTNMHTSTYSTTRADIHTQTPTMDSAETARKISVF